MKTIIIFSACLLSVFTSNSQTDEYQVLVQNRGSNAVQLYSDSGDYLFDLVPSGSGGLSGPEDILFLPDSTFLVSGFNNLALKRYDAMTGSFIGNFTKGYSLSMPSKMSIGPDSLLYVTQWGSTKNKVVRFDLNGQFKDEFTSVGTPNGLGHIWDRNKNFYISVYGNGGNGFIQKFDSSGQDLGVFISNTPLLGPTDIWWAGNGDMLVADWTSGKVWRYDSNGKYIGTFISFGMKNPEGVAYTPDGKLLLGDWGFDEVLEYDTLGNYQGVFAFGNGLTDPNGVHVYPFLIHTNALNAVFQKSVHIFPNPVTDEMHIQLGQTFSGRVLYYEISDINGRILQKDKLNEANHTIHTESLDPGIFFLRIYDDEVQVIKKVLVQSR